MAQSHKKRRLPVLVDSVVAVAAVAAVAGPVYVNAKTCAECGGKCCQSMPGSTSPEDWGAPNRVEMTGRLTEALASGRYVIDWWEGDPRGPEYKGEHLGQADYIRPAAVGGRGMRDPAWGSLFGGGNPCVFWVKESGCSLFHDARPLECRKLEPKSSPGGECDGHEAPGFKHVKHENAVAWIPFHDVLEKAEDAAKGMMAKKAIGGRVKVRRRA